MKKKLFGFTAGLSLLFIAGCASTTKLKSNVSSDGGETVILDWKGRTVGVDKQPGWLASMLNGKKSAFRKEYAEELGNDEILPIVEVHADSLDNAEALAKIGIDEAFGRQMYTAVNSTVGQSLNDGQKSALSSSLSMTKANFSGVREIVNFWQKEKTVNQANDGDDRIDFAYYAVYSINAGTYRKLKESYLNSILASNEIDSETKTVISSNTARIVEYEDN